MSYIHSWLLVDHLLSTAAHSLFPLHLHLKLHSMIINYFTWVIEIVLITHVRRQWTLLFQKLNATLDGKHTLQFACIPTFSSPLYDILTCQQKIRLLYVRETICKWNLVSGVSRIDAYFEFIAESDVIINVRTYVKYTCIIM